MKKSEISKHDIRAIKTPQDSKVTFQKKVLMCNVVQYLHRIELTYYVFASESMTQAHRKSPTAVEKLPESFRPSNQISTMRAYYAVMRICKCPFYESIVAAATINLHSALDFLLEHYSNPEQSSPPPLLGWSRLVKKVVVGRDLSIHFFSSPLKASAVQQLWFCHGLFLTATFMVLG